MKTKLKLLAMLSACLLPASAVRASLVINGGFETGDFTGWTQFGNTGFTGVQGSFAGVSPHEGSFQAFFGPVGSIGGISQTLSVIPGNTYDIDYWVHNFGGTPSEMSVMWGGDTLVDLVDPGAFPYTHYHHTVVAGGPSIEFGFQQNPS